MATVTYLARRCGGLFYVHVRVRFFSGTRTLLRFALRTASFAEAKTRHFAYLRWLLPMQNPTEIDNDIDLILSQVDVFLKEGVAEDAWQAHHRHHYLKTALALLADWRRAATCPIRYARFYARQKPFARALTTLGLRVSEDFDEHDIFLHDPDYLKPPAPVFGYVVDDDIAREVLEEEGPAHWPSISSYLLEPFPKNISTYGIGDTWGRPSFVPEAQAASAPAPTFPAADEPAAPTVAGPSKQGAPVLSRLLAMFLAEKHEETDSRKAER